ncbi:MAG TPA: BON domain-containing protein [Pirellulales bacterium]|nr:BON domain-containing protein [Pirellulales bacterium]
MISQSAASRQAAAGALSSASDERAAQPSSASWIERLAREWVADNCPYQFYFKHVDYRFDNGVLTLRGRVPSFYLKQILQAVLGQLPQIERIENRVEVVSSVGLSSAR